VAGIENQLTPWSMEHSSTAVTAERPDWYAEIDDWPLGVKDSTTPNCTGVLSAMMEPTRTGMRGRRRTICILTGLKMFHFPDRFKSATG
jgi:hypothetical protein